MQTETPQIDISRVLDAPRELVYRAFTDPDHFVAWWGPIGNSLPRMEIEFDVRPGGHQRWTEVSVADPGIRVHIYVDLTDVTDGELLDGLMHVTGQLPDGVEPFETRVRVEFYDEADGRDATQDPPVAPQAPDRQCRAGLARSVDQAGRHADRFPGLAVERRGAMTWPS